MNNTNTSLKSNIIYSTMYQILVLLIPLVTAPYTARVLGAERIGIYSYTQAFATYFVLFAMLGVLNYGNRCIAQVRNDKKEMSKTFWEIFSFQFFLTIIISAGYLGYIYFFVKEYYIIHLLLFLYVISAGLDITWFFFGFEKFKFIVKRNMIIKILNALAVFYFVQDTGDLDIYTFIMAFGILCSQIALWPFLFKIISFEKIYLSDVIGRIRPNLVLFVPVVAISLYNILNKIMLGNMGSTFEVGLFANSEKIVQIPCSIVMATGSVLMPRISNLIASGQKEKSFALFDKSLTIIILISICFAFGLASISDIFPLWFYGEEFVKCGLYIAWMCPAIVFKSIAGAIRTQLIIPMEKDYVYIISVFAGAIINVISNYILIPMYLGLGAVISTVLAEAVVMLIQVGLTWKIVRYAKYFIDIIVFLGIGMIMYTSVQFIPHIGMFINIVLSAFVGGSIFIVLSFLYFYYEKKDIFILLNIVSSISL